MGGTTVGLGFKGFRHQAVVTEITQEEYDEQLRSKNQQITQLSDQLSKKNADLLSEKSKYEKI
ncbi:hypothetical protein OVS_03885 [Mycoplasma ovis str. Michigan]|uniref:Uncharacterized protein n=1 Tax=Mycoplasma ovis str. Michigan TaxID=1415773 RepID=A0ABN4BRZ3_9MOLU|nr:hypothetical protein OVS_03885 [Mycoplasma ovis str. Michigan]